MMIRANTLLPPPIDLVAIGGEFADALEKITRRVIICAGTGCMAGGARKSTRPSSNSFSMPACR